MKIKLPALLLALGTVPSFALAQSAPPAPAVNPGGPMQTPSPQMRQMMREHMAAMRQFMERMRTEQRATRAKMLAELSAAHRLAVAHIVGELAISPSPDLRAAARQIDAVLSASERAAVLATARAQMAQMHAQMEQMRAQMQAAMAQMHAQMQRMHGQMWVSNGHERGHEHHTPDAGRALLHSLLPGQEGPRMLIRMHGAPPPRP